MVRVRMTYRLTNTEHMPEHKSLSGGGGASRDAAERVRSGVRFGTSPQARFGLSSWRQIRVSDRSLRFCIAVTLLLLVTSCGLTSSTEVPSAAAPAGTVTMPVGAQDGYSVSYPVSVPAGYGGPSGLAGDSSGSGAWFYAASRDDNTLFHWASSTQSLSRYSLTTSNPDLETDAVSTPDSRGCRGPRVDRHRSHLGDGRSI